MLDGHESSAKRGLETSKVVSPRQNSESNLFMARHSPSVSYDGKLNIFRCLQLAKIVTIKKYNKSGISMKQNEPRIK